MSDAASQTDVILPQRVDAYWHCCLLSTMVIDTPRTTAEMSEMACSAIDPEVKNESEAVYYAQGSEANESANQDPRQRKVGEVSKQTMRERCVVSVARQRLSQPSSSI